jgi:cellulose-binding protein
MATGTWGYGARGVVRREYAQYLSAIKWWQYADADTYAGTIVFSAPDALTTTFHVPEDAIDGQTIHALIQVTDSGAPPLTSFQRLIVTVKTQ